jgi:hypothetical protein
MLKATAYNLGELILVQHIGENVSSDYMGVIELRGIV